MIWFSKQEPLVYQRGQIAVKLAESGEKAEKQPDLLRDGRRGGKGRTQHLHARGLVAQRQIERLLHAVDHFRYYVHGIELGANHGLGYARRELNRLSLIRPVNSGQQRAKFLYRLQGVDFAGISKDQRHRRRLIPKSKIVLPDMSG